jgi:hypothetical protein
MHFVLLFDRRFHEIGFPSRSHYTAKSFEGRTAFPIMIPHIPHDLPNYNPAYPAPAAIPAELTPAAPARAASTPFYKVLIPFKITSVSAQS